MSREVVFVDGMRTAFGTLGKTLRNILGEELAGMTIKGLVERSKILEKGGVVDCVFMGSAIGRQHGDQRRPLAGSGFRSSREHVGFLH